MSDETRFEPDRNITKLAEGRVVFHRHHYNVFLQRARPVRRGGARLRVQYVRWDHEIERMGGRRPADDRVIVEPAGFARLSDT